MEIKRIRGLLSSGPRCLLRLAGEIQHVSTVDPASALRERGGQTRYLRLIGNGTSFIRDIISSRKITISLAAARRPLRGVEREEKRRKKDVIV
jgi:hypothetical protein